MLTSLRTPRPRTPVAVRAAPYPARRIARGPAPHTARPWGRPARDRGALVAVAAALALDAAALGWLARRLPAATGAAAVGAAAVDRGERLRLVMLTAPAPARQAPARAAAPATPARPTRADSHAERVRDVPASRPGAGSPRVLAGGAPAESGTGAPVAPPPLGAIGGWAALARVPDPRLRPLGRAPATFDDPAGAAAMVPADVVAAGVREVRDGLATYARDSAPDLAARARAHLAFADARATQAPPWLTAAPAQGFGLPLPRWLGGAPRPRPPR